MTNIERIAPTPFHPAIWLQALDDWKETASEAQLEDAEHQAFELWPLYLEEDGTLAPEWGTTAWTGRIYASHPPLQTAKKELRKAVTAKGRHIISADWTACHLQIIAYCSGDAALRGDLVTGDVYKALASSNGVGASRDLVKQAVLAFINGAGEEKLREILGEDPTAMLTSFGSLYPTASDWIADTEESMRDDGMYTVPSGLSIEIPENAPATIGAFCQTVEADAVKALLDDNGPLHKACDTRGVPVPAIIIPMHDEVVMLSPDGGVTPALVAAIEEAMEEALRAAAGSPTALGGSMCSVEYGPSWGDVSPQGGSLGTVEVPPRVTWFRHGEDAIMATVDAKKPPTPEDKARMLVYAGRKPRAFATAVNAAAGRKQSAGARAVRSLKGQAMARAMKLLAVREGLPVFSRADDAEIAQHLLASGRPLVMTAGEQWREFRKATGTWHRISEEEIHKTIIDAAGMSYVHKGEVHTLELSNHRRVALFQTMQMIASDPAWLKDAWSGVCFRDITLAFENGKARKYEYDAGMRVLEEHRLPFDFDKTAKCPLWEQTLDEVFRGDDDADEKKAALQEMVGAALMGFGTRFQHHPILFGRRGAEGKSVVLQVIAELFPNGSQTSQQPSSWEDSRFALSALMHARINLVTELQSGELKSTKVKAVLCGDPVEAEEKFKAAFSFQPRALHMVAANELPKIRNADPAVFRRFVVLEFNNAFHDTPDPDNRVYQRDYDRAADIIENELPGVAVWALKGLARRIKAGRYTHVPSSDVVKSLWQNSTDATAAFVMDLGLAAKAGDDEEDISGKALYKVFQAYCEEAGVRPLGRNSFFEKLEARGVHRVRPARETTFRINKTGAENADLIRRQEGLGRQVH